MQVNTDAHYNRTYVRSLSVHADRQLRHRFQLEQHDTGRICMDLASREEGCLTVDTNRSLRWRVTCLSNNPQSH